MFAQRLVVSFWLLVISLFIAPITILAAAPAASSLPSANPYTLTPIPSSVSPVSPLYTDLLVSNMFHTFSCLATGSSIIGQPCLTYQMTKNTEGTIQGIPVLSQVNLSGGALGALTGVIDSLYQNQPLRVSDYLASVGDNFGLVKEAHAQVSGSGNGILNPILTLWQVSRNIAYLIMIIIFVVIGLMVMFKSKINPQTVITAQAALPGLVIGLILITFSYFLAALLTDTAFIGTDLIGSYFSMAQDNKAPSDLTNQLKKENVLSIMSTFIGAAGQPDLYPAVDNVIKQLGDGPHIIIQSAASILAAQYASQFGELPATGIAGAGCAVVGVAGAINPGVLLGIPEITLSNLPNCIHNATLVAKTAIAATAGLIAFNDPSTAISWALYVILIAILLYTMFKLLLRLVNCFITIIFYTIVAPFHFLFASLPGRQSIATGWILDMLSNILAFPAIIAVFYFVNYLLGSNIHGFLTDQPPFPVTGGPFPIAGDGTLPLFGGMDTSFIRLMLAFGALIATPTIPDVIARTIGRVSQAGQLLGQEIGGGMRSGQGYIGQAGQASGRIGQGVGGLYDQPGWIQTADGSWQRSTSAISGARAGGLSRFFGTLQRKPPVP